MSRQIHQFSQTKRADIPRSSFDLSHNLKTTVDAGWLQPIISLEILPGDTINLKASLFGRLATPIKPILDNIYMETFFFFTPYRQVWENWEKFNGEQVNPADSTDFEIPRLAGGTVGEDNLADWFGIPLGLEFDEVHVSALPHRCFNKIWNFWFRDENLQDSEVELTDDGPDPSSTYGRRRRRKRRDYVTSGLPWPQKGDPVVIPLGTSADIHTAAAVGAKIGVFSDAEADFHEMDVSATELEIDALFSGAAEANKLYADLTTATTITINALRESFQIQKLLYLERFRLRVRFRQSFVELV